ncbi:hypothetical protein ROU88_05945 [Macrococcus capreoli]
MRWTKRKQLIEAFICEPLNNRISINRIVYRKSHDQEARMTITFDNKEIFVADNIQYALKSFQLELEGVAQNFDTSIEERKKYFSCTMTKDEASHYNNKIALYEQMIKTATEEQGIYAVYYLEDFFDYYLLSIDDALKHKHELIRAFAMIDKRLGKRKFESLDMSNEHTLVQQFYEIRRKSMEEI